MEYKTISVNNLKPFDIRDVRNDIVEKINERIEKTGFNPAHPLTVMPDGDGYYVLDGNHRLQALNKNNINEVPCVVYPKETDGYKVAVECNQDEDTYAPMDMFDWLNVIHTQKEKGKTQAEIGESIGWSRKRVSDFVALKDKIAPDILNIAKTSQNGRGAENAPNGAFNFTEGWFRNSGLYDLQPERQKQFMDWFLGDKRQKGTQQQKDKINSLKEIQEQVEMLKNNLSSEVEENKRNDLFEAVERGEYTTERLQEVIETLNNGTKDKAVFGVDCLEELKKLPDNSIDCVITDPPWGVNFRSFRDSVTPDFDEGIENTIEMLDSVFTELKRVTKTNAHLYIFYPMLHYCEFEKLINKHFKIIGVPLIWVKNNHTPCDFKQRYAYKYEPIFFAKGDNVNGRELNKPCSPNVLNFPILAPNNKWHDCQKPTELLKYFIENSTSPHETILDPFMGSGSAMLAAKATGRHYVGFEMDKTYESRFKREVGNYGME